MLEQPGISDGTAGEEASTAKIDGERIDLSQNPLPSYTRLRGRGQIVPAAGVIPLPADWVATDQETVEFVFRHPDDFSSSPGKTVLGNTRPLIPLEIDPPDHVRYRKLLDPFFAPGKLRPLEPVLRRQINEFIDQFIERDRPTCGRRCSYRIPPRCSSPSTGSLSRIGPSSCDGKTT